MAQSSIGKLLGMNTRLLGQPHMFVVFMESPVLPFFLTFLKIIIPLIFLHLDSVLSDFLLEPFLGYF